VVMLAAASRRAWRPLARSMRGVLALAAVSTALQWWALGAARAADSALDVVVLALAAAVVAGTTSTNDILDRLVAWTSPARHLGADPDRAALVIALAIQALPAAQLLAVESRDAARARGIRSPRAHLAPFVVRVVALAHRTGEALLARGMTDPTADEDDKLAHVRLW